jgi:two-component system, NarL family, sensor histidine kinase EvgS
VNAQTILVAEDSELMRFVTKRQLALLGATCEGARDGEQALRLWRQEPSRYWLLLTDLVMPQMDGFDLARAVRNTSSQGARLPIVAYTGKASPGETERCRRAGIDDCLAKPAYLHRLNGVLQRWRPRPVAWRTGSAMTPPEAASPPPPRGHRQRPGEAGSAAVAWLSRIHARQMPVGSVEN